MDYIYNIIILLIIIIFFIKKEAFNLNDLFNKYSPWLNSYDGTQIQIQDGNIIKDNYNYLLNNKFDKMFKLSDFDKDNNLNINNNIYPLNDNNYLFN